MDAAYENALRTVADAYEGEVERHGGKSLARVATIVVNNGTFFQRLREGKPFLVHNLEKCAKWFRDPQNWPSGIPYHASVALSSIGRPPFSSASAAQCGLSAASVACENAPKPRGGSNG